LGARTLLLVVILTLGLAWFGIQTGPRIYRQVLCEMGLRRVESHAPILRKAAAESGVDSCLLAGVMYVESRGQVGAVSRKGAMGLFQLMPPAAHDSARKLRLPEPSRAELLTNAELNARLGAEYLRWLIALEGPDPERVLVSYNAGRAKLARWEKEAGGWENWRAQQQVHDSSGAFTYAKDVLEFRDRFRTRGVIAGPLPGSEGGSQVRAAASPR
jgi:soluble lytic murein transglycosylase-like protein